MQIKKSDLTDRETFLRCRVKGYRNALRLVLEVFAAPELEAWDIPQVKLLSDRNDRYAVTIIFQATSQAKPLHQDPAAQSHLQWLVDKWSSPSK